MKIIHTYKNKINGRYLILLVPQGKTLHNTMIVYFDIL